MGCSYIYIYIYIHNIGISKHEKHLRLLSSGTKLYITFEFKGSSTLGERYTFFLFWLFHLPAPHLVRRLPKASASKRKSTVFSRGRSQLYSLTFSNLPKTSARFWCMTSFALPFPRFPSRAIVTSLSDTSALPARA